MKVLVITTVLALLVSTALAQKAQPQGSGIGSYYSATLTAKNQAPAGGGIPKTAGIGQFSLQIDNKRQSAAYSFWIANVEGYTMSHIHVGGPTDNGPVAVLLLPGLMAGASNNLTGATLPMLAPFDICNMVYSGMFTANDIIAFGGMPALTWSQFIGKLTSGNLYVNVHNKKYPGGVIRGQLMPSGPAKTQCPKAKTWWTTQDLAVGPDTSVMGAGGDNMNMGRKL